MRIGILTFQITDNFGSALQCFGLQEAVRSLCPEAEVEVINYRHFGSPAERRAYLSTMEDEKKLRASAFDKFRDEYINIYGELVWDTNELDPNRYDLCIVGSDQVWNDKIVEGHEDAFFLEYLDERTRKISYAASVGGVLSSEAGIAWLLKNIAGMDAVSIREKSAKEIIQNRASIQVAACIDPTLLYDKNFWQRYERKPESLGDEKYVLMYGLGHSWYREYEKKAAEMATKVADANGLKIIHYYYGQLKEWLPDDSRHCFCEGPQELLWLFHHAEYVICCSFHGTAFSIIFERPFYTFFLPDNGNRMKDLVTDLGIPDRYIDGVLPAEKWNWTIPWNKVTTALKKCRQQSLDYLKREIEAVYDN